MNLWSGPQRALNYHFVLRKLLPVENIYEALGENEKWMH